MSRFYINRPIEERKSRFTGPREKIPTTSDLPQRFDLPSPAEKARRVDELRAALAESALAFMARASRSGEGQQ